MKMNLGDELVAAVNAGGNWATSTVGACGPLYRNANNSRSNVNVTNGGRGSIQSLEQTPAELATLSTKGKTRNGGASGLVGTPKNRARGFATCAEDAE